MCNRGSKEYAVSEETGDVGTETNSVHSENQDDAEECVSSNLVHESLCEKEEKTECWQDDAVVDGEFAQDLELMKLMGLPLSFTASERRKKKVYVLLFIKTTGQTNINLILHTFL